MPELFLGETFDYWIELKRQAEELKCDKLIGEIATLRAKVSFYETRIDDMNRFMQTRLEVKG